MAAGDDVDFQDASVEFWRVYNFIDKYFRIDDETQNLRRAQAQLVLFRNMMAHMDDMKRIIKEVMTRSRLSHG